MADAYTPTERNAAATASFFYAGATVVCTLYDHRGGRALAVECQLNRQRSFGADVISRIDHGLKHGNAAVHNCIISQLKEISTAAVKQPLSRGKSAPEP